VRCDWHVPFLALAVCRFDLVHACGEAACSTCAFDEAAWRMQSASQRTEGQVVSVPLARYRHSEMPGEV